MKKLMTLMAAFGLSLILSGCFGGDEAKFSEGTDYTVLSTEKSSEPTVTEYFSFYCPHCNSFEPIVNKLKNHTEGKAKFEKIPVLFMGGEMAEPMAKGYAVMLELGVERRLVPLMFNRIHNQRNAPKSLAELRTFFVSNGVSVSDYNSAFNSFAVSSALKRYEESFKNAGLRGVPAIVINNKYSIELAKFNDLPNAFELVDYLLTL